jgi:DNA-binding transcriptional regulator of glucitol operon
VRRLWFSGRALALHATVVVVVTSFCLLARWQVHRALSGNTLSWAYAFEWPFFAFYAIYMWWKLLHDDDSSPLADPTPEEQQRLEDYNRYLASLREADRRRGRH